MLLASGGAQSCMKACAMQGAVFSDAYSGAKEPLTLAAFLHTWWLNAECHQASYQQQDAHEFYLNALQGMGNSESSAPPIACRGVCTCHKFHDSQ